MEVELIPTFIRLAEDVDLDQFTLSYCIRRLKSEGYKFLMVTLPKLAKTVLRSLEVGFFDRTDLTDFAWKGKALRYFRSYLKRIFDLSTGKVLEDVDAIALYQLRQLCEYFYKLAVPFDQRVLEKFEQKFRCEDAQLAQSFDRSFVERLRKDFETNYPTLASATIVDVLQQCRPRSGTGTYSAWKQSYGTRWYTRREEDYRYPANLSALSGYSSPYPSAPVQGPCTVDPDYSEVLFVPKDSRGPRVIVREPYSKLRFQMAFNSYLSNNLEKISKRRINFQDQLINRRLAEQSSKDRKLCTIDLQSASDRVSVRICRDIFRNSPAIRYFITNVRVERALLPVSKEFVTLEKLAGMGSGLTFPTMSLLIALASTAAIVDYYHCSYDHARSMVYVYGDDLIVPTCVYPYVRRYLEKIMLKVNNDKSFYRGFFRESCGGDYYNGQDVSPCRLKLSNSNIDIKGTSFNAHGAAFILQLERHCRELIKNGLVSLADHYYTILERMVGRLPIVSGESPCLGRYSLIPKRYGEQETGNYEEIKSLFAVPVTVEFESDPYIRLSRTLQRPEEPKLAFLWPDQNGPDSAVSVPHKVKLVRKKVSAFRLMG